MLRSNQQSTGRYRCGGYTTVNGNMLSWWERTMFKTDHTDVVFNLTPKYHNRPDLLAFEVYGRPDLQWFVLQYNNILDVIEEFTSGTQITLPTKQRLFGQMLVASPKSSPL